jgi:hypothetical protein
MREGKSALRPATRPWREIARELASEINPNRILELSRELSRAFDEQRTTLAAPVKNGDANLPSTRQKVFEFKKTPG